MYAFSILRTRLPLFAYKYMTNMAFFYLYKQTKVAQNDKLVFGKDFE